ncbi:MAG: alpha/beta hydrolase, partial [Dongiaceae bacterium]
MTDVHHRIIETNGIRMHIAEQGSGPLVLLCHGFPESWYSWRHQLRSLSDAGFHVVAPDMRGYGQTSKPDEIDQYNIFQLVGDMVGLLDALGAEKAVIIGHDWGAVVAWHAALFRPDRFRGVAALSVPFLPRSDVSPMARAPRRDDAIFYWLYFQEPGIAEAEFGKDIRHTIQTMLGSNFGSETSEGDVAMVPVNGGLVSGKPLPPLPSWLTQDDVTFFVAEFERGGFRAPLNWYRNIERNWQLMAPFAGAQVKIPALYMAGEEDLVLRFPGFDQVVANLVMFVPQLRRTILLPD